jgi:hypothetical protein
MIWDYEVTIVADQFFEDFLHRLLNSEWSAGRP